MSIPASLHRSISPPPTRRSRQSAQIPAPATVEAGQARLSDPVSYFHRYLEDVARPTGLDIPRLDVAQWRRLWQRNQNPHGRLFVVHQHDHPIAGKVDLSLLRLLADLAHLACRVHLKENQTGV